MSQKQLNNQALATRQASPFSLFRRLNDEMDRMFGTFGGERFVPQLEVRQREGSLVIQADMPGMERKDVNVEVVRGGLMISGERRNQFEDKRDGYFHSERSYGSFQRFIPLPESASLDDAKASFQNGVLEITVPNDAKASESRKLEISDGDSKSVSSN